MFKLPKLTVLLFVLMLHVGSFARADTLVMGRVSQEPDKTYRELKPILDYVVTKLQPLGISDGSIVIAKDQQEMINYLRQGKIDWVQKGVFDALAYSKGAGAEMALRSWREGVPNYYSVIFARNDSKIRTLKSLVGKKLALQDRDSTTSFFVPYALLRKAGLDLVELSNPNDKPPADKIGYIFAGKELTITTWVHRQIVDAGAYHNQNWNKPADNPKQMKNDLNIIYQSQPLPRMIEIFRKDLNPKIKTKLKELLLHAHEDPLAQEALNAYGPNTAKFDEFKGKAKEELMDSLTLAKYMPRNH